MYQIDIWFLDINKKKQLTEVFLPFIPIIGQYIKFAYEDVYYTYQVERIFIETRDNGVFSCIELDFT